MTNEKYFELIGELKSLNETNSRLEMWYNRQLSEIDRLRNLNSKEPEKLTHEENEASLLTRDTKMKLPFFHVMTNEKYFELIGELKSLNETNSRLEMWYNRQLSEIDRLRNLNSKEKARKIAYIENFCHGKD